MEWTPQLELNRIKRMIKLSSTGNFNKTEKFLKRSNNIKLELDAYGRKGVAALAAATPVNSGETANSWYYEITKQNGKYTIAFKNSNINKGVPIAIILQYGHGTNNGGWVEGRDYINPAIQPIFDEMAEAAWKEVKRL